MSLEIGLALLSAFSSLVIAVFSWLSSRQSERELEQLRSEIAERRAERDARRDYEYEARKRLYEEFEPLLFQFVELGRLAQRRIAGLARTARQGDLAPGKSWLDERESYYMLSTIYRLLAPLVIGRLMQRRLTLVDLAVDPKIRMQYLLIGEIQNVLTDDFDLAARAPQLAYAPNYHPDRARLIVEQPAIYQRQGLVVGYLDNIVDAMIIREDGESPRCMTYGEFEEAYREQDSRLSERCRHAVDLFHTFHPRNRPVLWRLLIAQAHLYRTLFDLLDSSRVSLRRSDLTIPLPERGRLDWRHPDDAAPEEEALQIPFAAAESYLADRLGRVLER